MTAMANGERPRGLEAPESMHLLRSERPLRLFRNRCALAIPTSNPGRPRAMGRVQLGRARGPVRAGPLHLHHRKRPLRPAANRVASAFRTNTPGCRKAIEGEQLQYPRELEVESVFCDTEKDCSCAGREKQIAEELDVRGRRYRSSQTAHAFPETAIAIYGGPATPKSGVDHNLHNAHHPGDGAHRGTESECASGAFDHKTHGALVTLSGVGTVADHLDAWFDGTKLPKLVVRQSPVCGGQAAHKNPKRAL
jgi:hypothetical protein